MSLNGVLKNVSHGRFYVMCITGNLKKRSTGERLPSPHLSPAVVLVVSPRAHLVIQQRADQGGGLLGVGAQVGRQDGVGGSALRVDGQL